MRFTHAVSFSALLQLSSQYKSSTRAKKLRRKALKKTTRTATNKGGDCGDAPDDSNRTGSASALDTVSPPARLVRFPSSVMQGGKDPLDLLLEPIADTNFAEL